VFKPYPHDGFPDGCFDHSNYEYRNYKGAIAPPEWKPFVHDPFPLDTFNHSNYSYRQGGFMGKRATPPPTTSVTLAPTHIHTISTTAIQMGHIIPTPTTTATTPTPSTTMARPQIFAPSPGTIASTSMLPPFGTIQYVPSHPEPLSKKGKTQAPRPDWVPSGSHSPASVGGATDGSVHFASPPTTPDDSPGQNNPKAANDGIALDEIEVEDDGEEPEPKNPVPIAFSKKKGGGPRRKARSPSPDTEDPADPDDELSRPSILTLRPWEEEDGTTSIVQDYRMLIHGRLHVGKVQTEW
jgi:hypothetical protein